MTKFSVLRGKLIRAVTRNNGIRVPSGSWKSKAEWTGVEGVEDPMARSDFTRGDTTRPDSLSSVGSTWLLALLRDR